jgi:hypothetical protein
MNHSVRSLLRVTVFGSMAAVLGAAIASTQAHVGTDRAAYTVTSAADRAAAAQRSESARRAVARTGRTAVKDTGLRVSSSGLLAECRSAADTAVRQPLRAAGGGRIERLSPRRPAVPVAPPVDYHVPVHDPNAVIMVSKQVTDPFGGMTVSGASLDTSPGTPAGVREFGVARCDALRRGSALPQPAAITRQAQWRDEIPDPVTSLSAAAAGLPRVAKGEPGRLVRGLPRIGGGPRHHHVR